MLPAMPYFDIREKYCRNKERKLVRIRYNPKHQTCTHEMSANFDSRSCILAVADEKTQHPHCIPTILRTGLILIQIYRLGFFQS